MSAPLYAYALKYAESGLSVLPIRADGTKAPALDAWKPYQDAIAPVETIRLWFRGDGNGTRPCGFGVAVVGGRVSGWLEVLDFDVLEWWERFEREAAARGLDALLASLPLGRTPSGGRHLFYRCEGAVEGNQPLARRKIPCASIDKGARQDTDGSWFKVGAAIETRGEGGYALVYPTPAECHPDRRPYLMVRGDLREIPEVTPEERDALFDIAIGLNEYTPPIKNVWKQRDDDGLPQVELAPGDDFNRRGDLAEVLERAGAVLVRDQGHRQLWRRPGKDHGVSATLFLDEPRCLHVFTSSWAPFEQEEAYSPFAVLALLQFDGAFSAAAKALHQAGYGDQPLTADLSKFKGTAGGNGTRPDDIPTVVEEGEEVTAEPDSPPEIRPADPKAIKDKPGYPYHIYQNRLFWYKAHGIGDEQNASPHKVCDFHGFVTTEAISEQGERYITIEGRRQDKSRFTIEMGAREFADPKLLTGALTSAVGAGFPIVAGMEKHLRPGLGKLTAGYKTSREIRQYDRGGWMDPGKFTRFLLPGHRDDDAIRIVIPSHLPYRVTATADRRQAEKALLALLTAKPSEFTLPLLAAVLCGPAGRLLGPHRKRYCLFVSGQTGSYKTTFSTLMLSLFGPEWAHDSMISKWGEGATNNALLALATHATDLPYLIDNYKPGTGGGEKAFTALTMNIVEGGERARLQRSSRLQSPREIHCWPICTGEDTPSNDAATYARLLILPSLRGNTDTSRLTTAQDGVEHLNALGRLWVEWLETEDGQATAQVVAAKFPNLRAEWLGTMGRAAHGRIASNLSMNQLAGELVSLCPAFDEIWEQAGGELAHRKGLDEIAAAMGTGGREANEAHRFLSLIGSLLNSGRAILADYGQALSSVSGSDRDRVIGWEAPPHKGGIYLDEELTLSAIEKLSGANALNSISKQELRKRLDTMGVLGDRDEGRMLLSIQCGSGRAGRNKVRVLHILPAGLDNPSEDDEDDDAE